MYSLNLNEHSPTELLLSHLQLIHDFGMSILSFHKVTDTYELYYYENKILIEKSLSRYPSKLI